ncbi:MAG: transcription-repair coupling factor [Clostridiales bacterium]|nr:transcription-repair coupling factor [Clostridiales bacterium]
MLDKILALKNNQNSLNEFCSAVRQGIPSAVFGVSDAFKNYLVSILDEKVLYIVKDSITARIAVDAVNELAGKKAVYLPPKDEILLMNKAYSKDNAYARMMAFSSIDNCDVIVTTAEALMQTAPTKLYQIELQKNQDVSQSDIISKLVFMGYTRVESVFSPATFAVRGDIIDLYPINMDCAIRIDFFGDNIEAIKKYDVDTRENLGYVDSASVLQTTEFVYNDDSFDDFKRILQKEIEDSSKEQKRRRRELYDDICLLMEKGDFDGLNVLSVLSKDCGTVFDLLDKNTVVIFDESKRIHEIASLNRTEFTERFNSLNQGGEVFSFAQKNFMSIEELIEKVKKFRVCAVQTLSTIIPFFNPLKIINPSNSAVADYQLDFKEVFQDIDNWLKSGYSITVCTGDLKRAENFSHELFARGIACSIENSNSKLLGVDIKLQKLTRGFIFHEQKAVVIGSGNLFSKPVSARKLKSKKQNFFTAPEVGDYCVHEVHGVGRVLGNKKLSSTEGTKDYVAVEYAGGDILYVPVEQMDILTRYLGGEKKPKLSKIGGKDFERVKARVKESIKKMSFDLKRLYQERDEQKGFKFTEDKELQSVFEGSFPFEDTPDQVQANQDICKDMTSSRVMDRLVCGDVGFGKTEVAFRAVFRAIVSGKQVAMLAPTTILTEQHYNTAVQRFKDFGVKIAVLNRFKTPKQQGEIIAGLKDGSIDFIIGTHRLLSKDVEFKDLGLLVLDEEQRFGVEHKEKIKLLKTNVDAITLTATPIPRTLHMSLSGIRSISTINTPPKKRLPVQTYVTEESDMLIKDAITREINRGGQAFILYNRVDSIFNFADRIKSILPNLKFTVVHGQMEEKTMETNVMGFYQGQTDVLISTTIIENGIDLPKANTIIVIDADRLGLSTLYQLKGRVGRSDRLAYAYFTFKREKILTDTAFERLNAIVEFAEMGSGIKIAMRDLEIRGAGNILGAEQHGHMEKIGYELYSKLLREEISGKEEIMPELDIRVTAFIPDKYIESSITRMDAYKEIAEISSLEAEKEFREMMQETYGRLPDEADNLINIAVVKLLAMKLGVKMVVINREQAKLVLNDFSVLANQKLTRAIDEFNEIVKISMSVEPTLEFEKNGQTNEQTLFQIKSFLIFAN